MSNIAIRRYQPGDEHALWQLYYHTTHKIVGLYYTQEQVDRWAPHDKDMHAWTERIEKTNPYVAIYHNEIVGFAELESDGHIDYFYVHHLWQGKGVGSMLYNAIEEAAIRLKTPYLYADVSIPAKAFFLSKGFEILEEQHHIIYGVPAPNFRMQKKLISFASNND